jgi:hypothetical protein
MARILLPRLLLRPPVVVVVVVMEGLPVMLMLVILRTIVRDCAVVVSLSVALLASFAIR